MYTTTEEKLLELPVPSRTRSYAPVPYKYMIDTLTEAIEDVGLEVSEKRYVANTDGQMATGTFITNYETDPELKLSFSFTNSYNKILKAGIIGGAFQKICSNGMYGSSVRFLRKHTGDVLQEIYDAIKEAVLSGEKQMKDLIYIKNRLREIELTRRTTSELLGRMFIEEALITSTQLNIVRRELDRPSFNYECPDSAFELFSHLTHSFKSENPLMYMKRHIQAFDFFKKEFEIQVPDYQQLEIFDSPESETKPESAGTNQGVEAERESTNISGFVNVEDEYEVM